MMSTIIIVIAINSVMALKIFIGILGNFGNNPCEFFVILQQLQIAWHEIAEEEVDAIIWMIPIAI